MKLSQAGSKAAIGGAVAIIIALGVIYSLREPSANPESTAGFDQVALEALREGTMKKLVFSGGPKEVSQVVFHDPDGNKFQLSDWQGKYVMVNFWATWCAPCRKEMPALDALQAEFQGDNFEVVTIAAGRNPIPAIERFFEEVNVTNLPILLDPKNQLSSQMAVFGMPTTMILNPEGKEIARMRGDAEWYSDSARAIIGAMIGAQVEG